MGEYLFRAVAHITYVDPASNGVESDSAPSDILDTQPPPYTAPDKKK